MSHGADLGAKDATGNTVMHFVGLSLGEDELANFKQTLEFLLSQRMDINVRNHNGETLLKRTRGRNMTVLVTYLKERF